MDMTNQHPNDNSGNPLVSILLLFNGFISNYLSNISYEKWKSEIFFYLSVLSVILIIIVNLPKAFNVVKKIFKK